MELDFKKKIIIGIFIVIVLGISGYLYFDYINNTEVSNIEIENLQNTKENNTEDNIIDKKDEQENLIIVHIAGSVINPGIVKIKEGSRLYEAIESAGGNTEEADLEKINLAFPISDGQKIYIPKIGEMQSYQLNPSEYISSGFGDNELIENNILENGGNKVNINTANQSELETLPGVGSAIAQKIIDYRTKNGKFETIEDLQKVNGIGDVKYDELKENICV